MVRLALVALSLTIICAVGLHQTEAQAFGYKVTIFMSDTSSFKNEVKGKLKISFRNGGNSYKYALSAE